MDIIRNKMNQALRINLKGGGSLVLPANGTAPIPKQGFIPGQLAELLKRDEVSVHVNSTDSQKPGAGNTGAAGPGIETIPGAEAEPGTVKVAIPGEQAGEAVEPEPAGMEITGPGATEPTAENPGAEPASQNAGGPVETGNTVTPSVSDTPPLKKPAPVQPKKTGGGSERKAGGSKQSIPKEEKP